MTPHQELLLSFSRAFAGGSRSNYGTANKNFTKKGTAHVILYLNIRTEDRWDASSNGAQHIQIVPSVCTDKERLPRTSFIGTWVLLTSYGNFGYHLHRIGKSKQLLNVSAYHLSETASQQRCRIFPSSRMECCLNYLLTRIRLYRTKGLFILEDA